MTQQLQPSVWVEKNNPVFFRVYVHHEVPNPTIFAAEIRRLQMLTCVQNKQGAIVNQHIKEITDQIMPNRYPTGHEGNQ